MYCKTHVCDRLCASLSWINWVGWPVRNWALVNSPLARRGWDCKHHANCNDLTCLLYLHYINVCMKFWFSCNFVYMDRHCCNNWPKHQFAIRILYCVLISHICVPVLFQVRWTPPWGRLEMALSAVSLCRGHMNTWRQSILWCFFLTEQDKAGRNIFFPTVFFSQVYHIYCI